MQADHVTIQERSLFQLGYAGNFKVHSIWFEWAFACITGVCVHRGLRSLNSQIAHVRIILLVAYFICNKESLFKRSVYRFRKSKKPENAIFIRFPAFKQQSKERSSLLIPRIMTRVLSHSMSPPGHPPCGFPLHKSIPSGRLLSGWYHVENLCIFMKIELFRLRNIHLHSICCNKFIHSIVQAT